MDRAPVSVVVVGGSPIDHSIYECEPELALACGLLLVGVGLTRFSFVVWREEIGNNLNTS